MKRVFIFAILFSVAFSYTSCRKSKECSDPKNELNTDQMAHRTGTATMIWWLPFSACAGEPKDCGPETVIVAKRQKLNSLKGAINNGSTAIGNFFNDVANWDVFPPNYPSTQQMEKLASGSYDIILIQSSADDETYYFLCGPADNLTASNPEFVVQGTYTD